MTYMYLARGYLAFDYNLLNAENIKSLKIEISDKHIIGPHDTFH